MDFLKLLAANLLSGVILLVFVYLMVHYEMRAVRDDFTLTVNQSLTTMVQEGDKLIDSIKNFSVFGGRK